MRGAHSSETRAKISAAVKQRLASPEIRAKISAAGMGRHPSPETREKLRAWQLGRKRPPFSEEWRAKIGAASTGRKHAPMTQEHRDALREGRKKWQPTPEWRARMSAAQKGKVISPEQRAKMRVAMLGNTNSRRARVIGECVYCFGPAKHRDHVIPRARGGPDTPDNLVTACQPCNASKGNRTPDEWLADGLHGHWLAAPAGASPTTTSSARQ